MKKGKTEMEDNLSRRFCALISDFELWEEGKCIWEERLDEIQNKIEIKEKKMLKVEGEVLELIPGEFVIAFVKATKKAVQYFEYMHHLRSRDFIKPESVYEDILAQLLKEQEGVDKSEKVPVDIVVGTLDVRLLELTNARAWKFQQHAYKCYLKKHGVKNVKSMLQSTYPDIKDVKAENAHLLSDPISTLVFQTIEKEYVMDLDPKVELLNIMKSNPIFYHGYFIVGKSPVEESAVLEALEEYSHFHSKYVKGGSPTRNAAEKVDSDISSMHREKHQFPGDTILLGQLRKMLSAPFPVIHASNNNRTGVVSGNKRNRLLAAKSRGMSQKTRIRLESSKNNRTGVVSGNKRNSLLAAKTRGMSQKKRIRLESSNNNRTGVVSGNKRNSLLAAKTRGMSQKKRIRLETSF